MKICFLSEAQSIHTKRWCEGLGKRGHRVHIISPVDAEFEGVAVHRRPVYSSDPVRKVNYIRATQATVKRISPDVIHLFGLFCVNSLGSMAAVRKWPNLIVSVWGSDIVGKDPPDGWRESLVKRYLLSRGRLILATSEYLARHTRRYTRTPVQVLPWGVDLDQFTEGDGRRGATPVTVGFAKRLHELSGPDLLLEAFLLAGKITNVPMRLKIAGEGPMRPKLEKMVCAYGLQDVIEWVGWLKEPADLTDFYHSIDLLAMPSRQESFGMTAVEAHACGVPVVATRIGGIPEVVVDGHTGILASAGRVDEIAAGIAEMATHGGKRRAFGKNARKRAVQLFSWENTLRRVERLYETVQSRSFGR